MGNTIIIPNRVNWIDWAKVIAISFVVFGHIPQEAGGFPQSFIIIFHMPLFFFISGYLTKIEYLNRNTLYKYWHTLIIPYFCYNLLFYPYWLTRHIIEEQNHDLFCFIRPIIGTVLFQIETPISESLNGVTWFIAVLVIMKLLLSYTYKYKHCSKYMGSICVFFYILYVINEEYKFTTTLALIGFSKCLIFFYLGHLCKQKSIIKEKQQIIDWGYCLLGILVSLLTFAYTSHTSIITYGITFGTICCFAIMFIISLSKLLNHIYSIVITNISNGTIVIMGTHWILIGTLNFAISKICHINRITYPLIMAIFLTILYEAILYPLIIVFINKYPFLLGKRK